MEEEDFENKSFQLVRIYIRVVPTTIVDAVCIRKIPAFKKETESTILSICYVFAKREGSICLSLNLILIIYGVLLSFLFFSLFLLRSPIRSLNLTVFLIRMFVYVWINYYINV